MSDDNNIQDPNLAIDDDPTQVDDGTTQEPTTVDVVEPTPTPDDDAQDQTLAAVDELTTGDGRKVLSFSASGESYSIESSEQAAKGRLAAAEAEMAEIKLAMMKRGILISKLR